MTPDLITTLEAARARGFLGPGPVDDHVAHAAGFAAAAGGEPERALDLGSGGGVPGLPLALRWPASRWLLLDSDARRAGFLEAAVAELGLADRVRVRHARAEDAGRDPSLRGRFDLVCARSFGPPGVVAECGAPFLRVGGRLVVSDPPAGPGRRWPADGIAQVGLSTAGHQAEDGHFTVLDQERPCPERFPRRAGIPSKRPLF